MAVELVQDGWCVRLSPERPSLPKLATVSDAAVECPPCPVFPEFWTREDVRCWLEGCVNECGLDLDLPDRFPMNGKGLCMLRKEDFRQRAPDAGDVLYNSLHSFYRGPSALPYERSSPDTLALKWKTNPESLRWFDPSILRPIDHRIPDDCKSEVDYEQVADSEPLNLKVTRTRQQSPASPPPPLPFQRTSPFDLSITRPLPLLRSPTSDLALNRSLPPLSVAPTFEPVPWRSQDRIGVALPDFQSQMRLYPPSVQPTYLPLFMPLSYIDLKQSLPTPASSPPSSLLSSSSLSSPPALLLPSYSLPTPSSSPTTTSQHATVIPRYHSLLSSASFLSSSSLIPQPPPAVPSARHGTCTSSPASAATPCASPTSPSTSIICSSPSSATITIDQTGLDQSRSPKSSISNEATPSWSQLMQVSTTTSQTPEADPKIHLNLSTSDRLLWKFLAELLNCKKAKCVSWEDRQRLTFQIVDPDELAELWGVEKCKPGMTYEKLSRALRYYYKMNIIAKVPGKRLTYRFITSPQFIKKGKRGAKPGVPHKRRAKAPLSKTIANQDKETMPHHQQQQQQQQQQVQGS